MKVIQILELLPGSTGKMLVIWSDRWLLYCSIHKFLFKGWIQNAELLCLCWLLTLEINITSLCLDCFLSRILSVVHHSELLLLCLRFCYIDSLWYYLCLHARIIHPLFQVFHLCFVHILFVFCMINLINQSVFFMKFFFSHVWSPYFLYLSLLFSCSCADSSSKKTKSSSEESRSETYGKLKQLLQPCTFAVCSMLSVCAPKALTLYVVRMVGSAAGSGNLDLNVAVTL